MNELLAEIISEQILKISFPEAFADLDKLARQTCFRALKEIKALLEDESLSDFLCVEEIIQVFERLGSNCGFRHDF